MINGRLLDVFERAMAAVAGAQVIMISAGA